MTKFILALALLAAPLLAGGGQFTVIEVDTRKDQLELFLKDDAGAPFRRLDKLEAWLQSKHRRVRFAMNAGMFEPDLSPVGLFVAQGREHTPLKLAEGRGNFFMKPNGVFFVTKAGPQIVRSTKYSAPATEVLLATQSGPLLLEERPTALPGRPLFRRRGFVSVRSRPGAERFNRRPRPYDRGGGSTLGPCGLMGITTVSRHQRDRSTAAPW